MLLLSHISACFIDGHDMKYFWHVPPIQNETLRNIKETELSCNLQNNFIILTEQPVSRFMQLFEFELCENLHMYVLQIVFNFLLICYHLA